MTTRSQEPIKSEAEKALQAALAVTPSPDFAARVRERVRGAPVGAPVSWWPRFALAGAVVMAGIVAVAWWNGRAGPERASVIGRSTTEAPAAASEPAREPQAAPEPPRAPDVPASRSTARQPAAVPRLASRAPAGEQPRDALVPDDERRALNRLLIAMRQGRAAVPAPRRVLEDENGLLLEPRPIEIPLMRPIEPLPGMAADRPGSKDR